MQRWKFAVAAAALLLVAASPAYATDPGKGTIDIMVQNPWYDANNNGRVVVLGHPELSADPWPYQSRVENVPAGTYQVQYLIDPSDFRSGGLFADPITVTMGPDTYPGTAELKPHYVGWRGQWWDVGNTVFLSNGYGTVSGRVTDSAGLPVVGAAVYLQWDGSQPGVGMTGVLLPGGADTTTDADGRYSFRTFAGPHGLVVKAPGLQPQVLTCTVSPGQGVLRDFVLSSGDNGSIAGVVFNGWSNPRHMPFPGARVTLDGTETVLTGKDGGYRFDGVPPGYHLIDFAYPGCWFSGPAVGGLSHQVRVMVATDTVGGWAAAVAPVGGAPLVMYSDVFFTPESGTFASARLRRGGARLNLAVNAVAVTPGHAAGLAVDLQQKIKGRWTTVRKVRTNSRGRAHTTIRFRRTGRYAVRWAIDPKAKRGRAYSSTVTIRVKR